MEYSLIVYILLFGTIVGWGAWGFFSKLGIGSVGTFVNMAIINLVNAVIVLILGFFTMSHGSLRFDRSLLYPVLGGIGMGAGTVAYFLLVEKFNVSTILPLTILYLVVAVGLSVVFLHEHLKLVHIIGIILMIAASFLLSQ